MAQIEMIPAVRDPNTPKMQCIDEPKGDCSYERVTLCAFDAAASFEGSNSFLDCMDNPWDEELTPKKPKACAEKVGLDWKAISSCNSGTRGDELLQQASEKYVAAFPKPAYMPAASVNGEVLDDCSYDGIKKAACTAGSSSSAC
mmetsp:Transcript_26486/g.49512  ORF Transcript_26486/g.49512 Transcript_26486/m.49512 type:complete len:144 (-) Transcript_26486:368-799(-)